MSGFNYLVNKKGVVDILFVLVMQKNTVKTTKTHKARNVS